MSIEQTCHNSNGDTQRMKMTLEIEGNETFDLELALNEALRLVAEGYTSGFDQNDTGNYRFSITAIN
ncbi:MAG: hypothetical protein KGZ80_06735 [Methylomonas sp.]|nr:hypothetical protein [Methylomonas sp.]